jgi:hypothetical protein
VTTRHSVLGLALAALLLPGCSIDEQGNLDINFVERQAPEFRWQGAVPAGGTLEIKGVSGTIEATIASDDQVHILAERKGRSDPEKVKVEVVEHSGGVTVCAVYPTRAGDEPNVCKPGREGHLAARNYNASVNFTVQVPAGVAFVVRNVNGSVKAMDVKSNLDLHTINGNVRFATDGYGQASTTNGTITGSMGRADWSDALRFETVNGSVRLTLPPTLHARVDARTVNGRVSVEYPLAQAEESRRRVTGLIGGGGRELHVEAVNGSVQIGKAAGS